MIVVDASALVEVLLGSANAPMIEARLFEIGDSLHSPHLVDVEVANVFRRLAIGGEIDAARGRIMLALLGDLPIRRYPHGALMPRVWDLRSNVTAYDAVYVALAEALGATLLTRDGKLARAVGHLIAIELV